MDEIPGETVVIVDQKNHFGIDSSCANGAPTAAVRQNARFHLRLASGISGENPSSLPCRMGSIDFRPSPTRGGGIHYFAQTNFNRFRKIRMGTLSVQRKTSPLFSLWAL